MGPNARRHHSEDAYDLLPFFCLQLPDAVIGLHDLCGLYIHRAAGGTLVMDDTLYLPLHRGHDGNDQTAVTQSGCHVFLDDAVALRRPQDAVEYAGDRTGHGRQLLSDAEQLRRGVVAQVSELVNDLVDLLHKNGKCRHAVGQVVQGRILPFLQYGEIGTGSVAVRLYRLALIKKINECVDGLH